MNNEYLNSYFDSITQSSNDVSDGPYTTTEQKRQIIDQKREEKLNNFRTHGSNSMLETGYKDGAGFFKDVITDNNMTSTSVASNDSNTVDNSLNLYNLAGAFMGLEEGKLEPTDKEGVLKNSAGEEVSANDAQYLYTFPLLDPVSYGDTGKYKVGTFRGDMPSAGGRYDASMSDKLGYKTSNIKSGYIVNTKEDKADIRADKRAVNLFEALIHGNNTLAASRTFPNLKGSSEIYDTDVMGKLKTIKKQYTEIQSKDAAALTDEERELVREVKYGRDFFNSAKNENRFRGPYASYKNIPEQEDLINRISKGESFPFFNANTLDPVGDYEKQVDTLHDAMYSRNGMWSNKDVNTVEFTRFTDTIKDSLINDLADTAVDENGSIKPSIKEAFPTVVTQANGFLGRVNNSMRDAIGITLESVSNLIQGKSNPIGNAVNKQEAVRVLNSMSDDELVRAIKLLDPTGKELSVLKDLAVPKGAEGEDAVTKLEASGVLEYKVKKVIGATALSMVGQWQNGKNHRSYLEHKDSATGLANSGVGALATTTKIFKQLVGQGGAETLDALSDTLISIGDSLNTDFIKNAGKSVGEKSDELKMDAYLWSNIEQQSDAEKWGYNTLEMARRSHRDNKVFEEWGGGVLGAVGVGLEYIKTGDVANAFIESIPYMLAGRSRVGTVALAASYTATGVNNAKIQDLQHRSDDFGATEGLSNIDYNIIAATGALYATLNRGATALMTRTGGGTVVGAAEDFMSKYGISRIYKIPKIGGVLATTASVGVKSGLVAGGGEAVEELIQTSVFDPVLNNYHTIKQKLASGTYLDYYREKLLDQGLIAAGIGGSVGSSMHFGMNSYNNIRNGMFPGTDRIALYEHKLGEADKAVDEELSMLARSMTTTEDREQTIKHLTNTLDRLEKGKQDLEVMQDLRDKVVDTDEYKNLLNAFNNRTKAETELARAKLDRTELEGSTAVNKDFTDIDAKIADKQEVFDNYEQTLKDFSSIDSATTVDIDGKPNVLRELLYKFDMAGTSVASIERMNTIYNNKKKIEDKLGKDSTKELDTMIDNYLSTNSDTLRDEDVITLEAITATLLAASNKKQSSEEVDHSKDIPLISSKGEVTKLVINEDDIIQVGDTTHYVIETENDFKTVTAKDTTKSIGEKGNFIESTKQIGDVEAEKAKYQDRVSTKAKDTILATTKSLRDGDKTLDIVEAEVRNNLKGVLSKDTLDSISDQSNNRKRTTVDQKIAFAINMINGLDRTHDNNQVHRIDDVIKLTSDYKTKVESSERTVHNSEDVNQNVVRETTEDLANTMVNIDWTQFYKTRLKRRSATKVREELDKWDNEALMVIKQTNNSSNKPVRLLNRLIDMVIKDRAKTDNLLTASKDDYVFNIERIVSEKYHEVLGINPVTASYQIGKPAWSPITAVKEEVADIPKPDGLEEAAKVIVSSGTGTNVVVDEFDKQTKDIELSQYDGVVAYATALTNKAIPLLASSGVSASNNYDSYSLLLELASATRSKEIDKKDSKAIKKFIRNKVYKLSGEDNIMSAKITNTTRLRQYRDTINAKLSSDTDNKKSMVKLALVYAIESMAGKKDFTIQDIVDKMSEMDVNSESRTEEEHTVYMQNTVEVLDELFNDEANSAQAGIIINAVFSASDTIKEENSAEVNKAFNSEVVNTSSVKMLSKQMFGDSLKVKLYKNLSKKQKRSKSKSGTIIKTKKEKKGKQASIVRTFSNIIDYFNTGDTEYVYDKDSSVSDSLKQANAETFMPENISNMYAKALGKLPDLGTLLAKTGTDRQSAVFNSRDSQEEYEGKVKILLTLGINEILDNMSSNMDIESKNASPEDYTSTIAAKKYEVVNQIGKKYMDLFGLNVYNSNNKASIVAWRNKVGEEAIILLKELGMVDTQKGVEFTVDPNSLVRDNGKSVYKNNLSVGASDIRAFKETGKRNTAKNTKRDSQTGVVLTSNLVNDILIYKVGSDESIDYFNLDAYEKTEKDTIVSMLFEKFHGIQDPLRPLNPGNKHTPSANNIETPHVQKNGAKIAKEHQEFMDKMQESPLKLSNTARKLMLPLVKAYAEAANNADGGYLTVMKFLRNSDKGKNIARMLGITSAEVGLVDDNLASNLGKELGKGNHLVNILRFIVENSEDDNYEEFMKRDLYFSHDVGRNMRGHLNEQTLNYQADKKYSRNLLTGGEYTTSNLTEYLILLESISDKTGLSSDQILGNSGNEMLETLLNSTEDVDSTIEDIVSGIVESDEGVIDANKELLQSLDLKNSGLIASAVAIKAIKDIRTANKSGNKFSVTTEYMPEVDATSSGFTNISLNLLGYIHNKATTQHYLKQGDQDLLKGGVIDGYKVLTKLLEDLKNKLSDGSEVEGDQRELTVAEKMLSMANKKLNKDGGIKDNLKVGAKIMFNVLQMSPRDAAKVPSMVRGYHASVQAISRNVQIEMRSGLLEAYASGNKEATSVLQDILGKGDEVDVNNLDLSDYKKISEAITPFADRIAKEAENSLKDQTDVSNHYIGKSYDLLAEVIHGGLVPGYKTIKMNSIFEVMKGIAPNRANAEVLMKQKHVLLEDGGIDTNDNMLVDLKDMPNSPTSKVIPFHMIDSYLLSQSYSDAYAEVYGGTDQATANKIKYGVMTIHDAVYGNTEMLAAFSRHYNSNTIKVAKEFDVVEQMLNEVKYVVDTYGTELNSTPKGKTQLKRMEDHIAKMEVEITEAKARKEKILENVNTVQVMGASKPGVREAILNGIIKHDSDLKDLRSNIGNIIEGLSKNEDSILSKDQVNKIKNIDNYLKGC